MISVVICNPRNAESFEDNVDLIVFRNTGSVLSFKDVYDRFTERVRSKGLNTFNEFVGKSLRIPVLEFNGAGE